MIRVLIADDEPLVRAGIVALLGLEDDLVVIAEAADGNQAVAAAVVSDPDVVVMDLRMPGLNGVEATRRICQDGSRAVKVLVLTTSDDAAEVHQSLIAGASGYLLKESAPDELAPAIRRVAAGDGWLDPGVTRTVITAAAASAPRPNPSGVVGRLTRREREVLALIAEGLSNTDIANRLVVGDGTVKTHISRILFKTGCRDRAQAVALAYRSGLLA